jgi:hypothetical protein
MLKVEDEYDGLKRFSKARRKIPSSEEELRTFEAKWYRKAGSRCSGTRFT